MENIRQLIAAGNIANALEKLGNAGYTDALLLLAQYNSGLQNFNMGLIDYSEWQRISARVAYGALEICNKNTTASINEQNIQQITAPKSMNKLEQINNQFVRLHGYYDNRRLEYGELMASFQVIDMILGGEYVSNLLDWAKVSSYHQMTTAEKAVKFKETLETLFSYEADIINKVREVIEDNLTSMDYRELYNLFMKNPNNETWAKFYNLAKTEDKLYYELDQLNTAFTGKYKTPLDWGLRFKGSKDQQDLEMLINS